MLKSSEENVIMILSLSVLPSFCIRETSTAFLVYILGGIIENFFYLSGFQFIW